MTALEAVVDAVQSLAPGGVPVSTRLPAEHRNETAVRVEIFGATAPVHSIQPLTVTVQAYAASDEIAGDTLTEIWTQAGSYTSDSIPTLTPAIPPAPRRDPDKPHSTRWQMTLTATYTA